MIYCRFVDAAPDAVAEEEDDDEFSYRTGDLCWPAAAADLGADDDAGRARGGGRAAEELRRAHGAPRSRRELVLMARGDEGAARACWAAAASASRRALAAAGGDDGPSSRRACAATCCTRAASRACSSRASRARRAPSRCGCRACGAPPRRPTPTRAAAAATAAPRAAAAAARRGRGRGRGGRGRDGGRAHRERRAARGGGGIEALARPAHACPACFAGPLLNEQCSDLRAHHGQCPRCSDRLPRADAAIAEALAKAGGARERVGALLPRCARCDVAVLFNGCTECGHLFADTDWNALPAWDVAPPKAGCRLRGVRACARARRPTPPRAGAASAALLAHERGALHDARTSRFAGTRK